MYACIHDTEGRISRECALPMVACTIRLIHPPQFVNRKEIESRRTLVGASGNSPEESCGAASAAIPRPRGPSGHMPGPPTIIPATAASISITATPNKRTGGTFAPWTWSRLNARDHHLTVRSLTRVLGSVTLAIDKASNGAWLEKGLACACSGEATIGGGACCREDVARLVVRGLYGKENA
jgi:hypothetical protein